MMINKKRFLDSIRQLAQYNDTPGNGISRFSYSRADRRAREWLSEELSDCGLRVWTDGIGNLHGRLKGESGKPAVLTGSHLDSVPNGGRLDGSYGILAALETLRCFKELNITPHRDLEFVAFAEEEGSNFGTTCVGSKAITGNLSGDDLLAIKDRNGIPAYSRLKESGYYPENIKNEQLIPENYLAYLELHIEQNSILEKENAQIGAVTEIFGMRMFRICYNGESKHAATPMRGRRDPMQGLIAFGHGAGDIVAGMGDDLSLTIGQVLVEPNAGNVIASRVAFTVDLRHLDNDCLFRGAQAVIDLAEKIADECNLGLEIIPLSSSNAVKMDCAIVRQIVRSADRLGRKSLKLTSGPAHDAVLVGQTLAAGLIFVPSINGLSHCPSENTDDLDLIGGVKVYQDVLQKLCMQV